ncbi:MAG: exodeoxyribonuclease III [Thermoplasmatota archaeon]
MRLVSWNINSLRARIGRVQAFLERHDPDILCLQETKVQDAGFPRLAFMEHHITTYGQPTYNGVAILSKKKPDEVLRGFPGDPTDHARVLAARFDDLWVYNLYVVNGKSPDDPAFLIKKTWFEALGAALGDRHDPGDDVLLLGDFNITPTDLDTHDPEGLAGHIHHTTDERAWLQDLMDWGLHDLHRQVTDDQVFTWWDYRNLSFQKNEGLRIDLALGSQTISDRVQNVWVDRDERKVGDHAEKPSDHAPLVVDW